MLDSLHFVFFGLSMPIWLVFIMWMILTACIVFFACIAGYQWKRANNANTTLDEICPTLTELERDYSTLGLLVEAHSTELFDIHKHLDALDLRNAQQEEVLSIDWLTDARGLDEL